MQPLKIEWGKESFREILRPQGLGVILYKKITVLEKENADLDRLYWMKKSPEERLSAVEFLREQFYAIKGYATVPRLVKKIHIAEGFD